MLCVALWLISPVIPAALQLAMWAGMLIVPAIYLHALDSLPSHASAWTRLWKGVGIIALVTGIALLVGALAGSNNLFQPLAGLRITSSEKPSTSLPFKQVKNLADLDSAVKQAAGRFILLDFYADWCVACKEYEQFTFSDPQVQKLLNNVILLKADVTQNNADDAELLARFHLFGPPGILFFDQHGHEMPTLSVIGYQDASHFLVTLNNVFSAKEGKCAPALEC
jgi:thiol:disulfide interchange protein DsbD